MDKELKTAAACVRRGTFHRHGGNGNHDGLRSASSILRNVGKTAIALSIGFLSLQTAFAADPSAPDYKAGYAAGYKAAMAAMKSATHAENQAAQPNQPAQQAAGALPAHPAGAPRDWWNHSALIYSSLTPRWQHHIEAQFSGASMNGNDTGHAVSGSGKLFSRFGRWNNDLEVSIDNRHIAQAGGEINQRDYKMLQESLRYDLNDKLYTSAGIILERDDVNYIDKRGTVLAGLGYYVFDNPRIRLNTFAGLGRLHESYLDPVPGLIGIDGRGSNLLYLYETFDWQLGADWSLQQGFRQIRDLEESGRYVPNPSNPNLYVAGSMVKRYRNVTNVALNYKLSPRSALSFSVESRYDSNPWPDVKSRDIVRRVALKVMY